MFFFKFENVPMLNSAAMKSWTAGQMFFVFDTEYCQNEEDDPKDAILYFYPLETTDTMRCTLCCQLMGICNFMKSCFSPVSLIRLGKGKFAVRSINKYTLALRGTVDMPDAVLQRQMDSLISLFKFHHCSFETVLQTCGGSRKQFLEKMTDIWNVLLPISQHGGNTLSLTFDLVASIDLPKTAGLLYLQASQLLQACQRYEAVYAGCLMCDQRVLHTQLSTKIMHKLAFAQHKRKLPGEQVPVAYTLPGSVSLAYVYVDGDELEDLRIANGIAIARRSVGRESIPLALDDVHSTSDDTTVKIAAASSVAEKRTHLIGATAGSCDYPSSSLDESSGSDCPSSYESCPDDFADGNGAPASLAGGDNSAKARLAYKKSKGTSGEAPSMVVTEKSEPLVLYLQECSQTVLALFLRKDCADDSSIINSLWQLGVNAMTNLEYDVKSCLEMSSKRETKSGSKYLYLQHDKNSKTITGNVAAENDVRLCQQVFNRSVHLLHEDFLADSRLYETTVSSHNYVVHGHRVGARETYFQQTRENGGGAQGFPLQSDAMASISGKARRRLERDRGVVLL